MANLPLFKSLYLLEQAMGVGINGDESIERMFS